MYASIYELYTEDFRRNFGRSRSGNEIKNIWQLIGFTSFGVCCRGFESHQNLKSSVAQLVEHRFNPIISPKGCRQLLLLTSN